MISRYAADCVLCGGDIHAGDEIELVSGGGRRKPAHDTCAEANRAANAARKRTSAPSGVEQLVIPTGQADPGWKRRQTEQETAIRAQQDRIRDEGRIKRAVVEAIGAKRPTAAAIQRANANRNLEAARSAEKPTHRQQRLIANAAKRANPGGLGLQH